MNAFFFLEFVTCSIFAPVFIYIIKADGQISSCSLSICHLAN
jgi:hypothetical protein